MSAGLGRRLRGIGRKGDCVALSPEYLEYVLDLLAEVPEVTTRKMMGEYLLYASGKLFGGLCAADNDEAVSARWHRWPAG